MHYAFKRSLPKSIVVKYAHQLTKKNIILIQVGASSYGQYYLTKSHQNCLQMTMLSLVFVWFCGTRKKAHCAVFLQWGMLRAWEKEPTKDLALVGELGRGKMRITTRLGISQMCSKGRQIVMWWSYLGSPGISFRPPWCGWGRDHSFLLPCNSQLPDVLSFLIVFSWYLVQRSQLSLCILCFLTVLSCACWWPTPPHILRPSNKLLRELNIKSFRSTSLLRTNLCYRFPKLCLLSSSEMEVLGDTLMCVHAHTYVSTYVSKSAQIIHSSKWRQATFL